MKKMSTINFLGRRRCPESTESPATILQFQLHVVTTAAQVWNFSRWALVVPESRYFCRIILWRQFLVLKGVWHETGFFHESVSPRPISIPLGPFWIFSKIQWHRRKIHRRCRIFYRWYRSEITKRPKIYRRCQRHRRKTVHRCQRHHR